MFRPFLAVVLTVLPTLSVAQACAVNADALAMAHQQWRTNYPVSSDIDCTAPAGVAQEILCQEAAQNGLLWHMAELDDAAFVYAFENATGRETLPENPPRDETFIATRDACMSAACLCKAYTTHTDDSLGGMTPYQ